MIVKKLFLSVILNVSLFFLLVLAIQNSNSKGKLNLIFNKTNDLPISFLLGSSFISGSILGSFSSILLSKKD